MANDAPAEKQSAPATRRGPLLILCGLLAILAATILLAAGVLHQQDANARTDAEQHLNELLSQSRSIAADYARDREQQRAETTRRLSRQAETVCADVQVFLQAAVIRRESENNVRQLAQMKQKRDRLVALVRQQAAAVGKITSELSPDNAAAITTIQPIAAPASDAAAGTISASSAPGDTTAVVTAEAIPAPGDLVKELQKTQEENLRLADLLSADLPNSESGQDAAKAPVQGMDGKKKTPDENWPERLLRECGADLESLLPENCAFSAAEAGGKLLLALGGGKASAEEVRAESSRSLLLQAQGKNLQWVIRVALADPDAPARPNARELARLLTERLGLNDSSAVTINGWVLNEKGEAEIGFPTTSANELPEENARPGAWFPAKGGVCLLRQTTPLAPAIWTVALQVRLPARPLPARAEEFVRAHPLYAGGLLTAALLLLGGIVTLAILAARGGGVRVLQLSASAMGGTTGTTGIRPVLGSLERLQRANRGRSGEGSRILDLARSGVLRELAARIRQQSKEGKPSVRSSAPALREYRK